MSTFKNIKPITVGTNVVMLTDFNKLARTGTIQQKDTSCLHAILTSYAKKYREMSDLDKHKYVVELRQKICKDITLDKWLKEFDHIVTIDIIHKKIKEIVIKVYKFLKHELHESKINDTIIKLIINNIQTHSEYFESIMEIMPLKTIKGYLEEEFAKHSDVFDTTGKPATGKPATGVKTSKYKENLISTITEHFKNNLDDIPDIKKLKDTIYKKLQEYFKEFICNVISTAENIVYNDFIKHLKNDDIWIDNNIITYLAHYFRRNIYIIDSKTRYPSFCSSNDKVYGKSIILLHIAPIFHYESIGTIDPSKRIIREFKTSADVIHNIQEILQHGTADLPRMSDIIPTSIDRFSDTSSPQSVTQSSQPVCTDSSSRDNSRSPKHSPTRSPKHSPTRSPKHSPARSSSQSPNDSPARSSLESPRSPSDSPAQNRSKSPCTSSKSSEMPRSKEKRSRTLSSDEELEAQYKSGESEYDSESD